jgi:transposase InsO family protein
VNDIEHGRTNVRRPQPSGFIGRFNRTTPDEFFRNVFRTKFHESVQALQADRDAWLVRHNTEEGFWTLADPAGNEVDVAATSAPSPGVQRHLNTASRSARTRLIVGDGQCTNDSPAASPVSVPNRRADAPGVPPRRPGA